MTLLSGVRSRLHHVGFVVADIEASMPRFVQSLGGTWNGKVIFDPCQNVKVAFLSTHPMQPQIELVGASQVDGPVTRFLEQKGEGLHHLCYEVADLDVSLGIAKKNGMLLAKPPKPAVAFDGRRIAWVLTPEKMLIELLEAGGTTS